MNKWQRYYDEYCILKHQERELKRQRRREEHPILSDILKVFQIIQVGVTICITVSPFVYEWWQKRKGKSVPQQIEVFGESKE